MSQYRRFSINKDQGEIISLALVSLISELIDVIQRDPSPVWKFYLDRAERLKHELDKYNWKKPR